MRNYIVRYPGKRDGIIVLASHYETNYPLRDIDFVGANDGACTSALLIQIGAYLRAHPPQGYSVWLVFDPSGQIVYVLNEAGFVASYTANADGSLTFLASVATGKIPASFAIVPRQ